MKTGQLSHFGATKKKGGFSLLEVLVVVSLLGVLATIGTVVTSEILNSSKRAKLQSEAKTLNSAVLAYIASNGDLTTVKTMDEVVAKLKSRNNAASGARVNGLRGGFLDPRVEIVFQTEEEAASDNPRILWDQSGLRFHFATAGPVGIKRLRLNDDAAMDLLTEDRSGTMKLAEKDTWIWDYIEAPLKYAAGPSTIPTFTVAASPVPAAIPVPLAPVPSAPTTAPAPVPLDAPEFSIPGGSYPLGDYDLSIYLVNPNPLGSSELFYSINYGAWEPYVSALVVSPDMALQAQAMPIDTDKFTTSPLAQAIYGVGEAILDPPGIFPDFQSFGFFTGNDILVMLANPNTPGVSEMFYRVDGGPWTSYIDTFLLLKENHPVGAVVEARAVPVSGVSYQPSSIVSAYLPANALDLSGTTSGQFYSPIGPDTLVTNLSGTDSDSYFEWGEANSGTHYNESWMELTGTSFGNIINGDRFHLGSLEYFNGTIKSGTGAESVFLDITLSLDINGTIFNPYFDFEFDLINTANTSDEWDSADYVLLEDATASRTLVFNGYEFEFQLEFGDTTEDGFAEFDEFHVLENKDAAVNLFGSLNLINAPKGGPTDGLVIWDGIFNSSEIEIYQNIGYRDPAELAKILKDQTNADLKLVKLGRDTAEDESKWGIEATEDFTDSIDRDKFGDAELLVEAALFHANAAENGAREAEVARDRIREAEATAQEAALLRPEEVEKDLEKIMDILADAEEMAAEARAYANAATAAADAAAADWEIAKTEALSGSSVKYARYLADLAELQVEITEDSAGEVQKSLDDINKATIGMNLLISELDYDKIEKLLEKIDSEIATAADAVATAIETTDIARTAASEAASIAAVEPKADKSAIAAQEAVTEAEAFVALAQSIYLDLMDSANEARVDLDEALADGPDKHPFEYANFLLGKVKDAAKLVKEKFDLVKDSSKEAEDSADDAKDFIDDEELTAAGIALDAAYEFASIADLVVPAVTAIAPSVRPLAEEVGKIAAKHSVAAGAYADALKEADEAEELPAEARALADEAAIFAAEAEEYIINSLR